MLCSFPRHNLLAASDAATWVAFLLPADPDTMVTMRPYLAALTSESRLPSRAELVADGVVHVVGVTAGVIGAVVVVTLAAVYGGGIQVTTALIYAAGLLCMLGCSAAYNLARSSRWRPLLQRFDHAAIFVMIAGTYTPITVLRLDGLWGVGLTSAVWSLATLGMIGKLLRWVWIERMSTAFYILLGWTVLLAIDPLLDALETQTLVLLGIGGALYTLGVVFHVWERLPFQNAVWHCFVLTAASVHYAALLSGVILTV